MGIFYKQNAYWIDYTLPDGRRKREKVGPQWATAKKALDKRRGQIADLKFFPEQSANNRTFSFVADKYWDLHGKMLRWDSIRYMLKEFRTVFGKRKIGAITSTDIQRFYFEVLERASISTANRNLTLLKSIFNWAKKYRHFNGENPCVAIKRQKEPPHRLRYLSQDEMRRLLAACHPRLLPVVLCGLHTGMRRQEILDLCWENVDLERGLLTVLKSKSGKPRHLPIDTKLRAVMQNLSPGPNGSVFNLPDIMLRRYFERALKIAAIPATGPDKVVFHSLRHTFSSWFMMRGGNLYTLKELLGHSSISMTMRYAHLSPGHFRSEMAIFESAIPDVPISAPDTLMTPALAKEPEKPQNYLVDYEQTPA